MLSIISDIHLTDESTARNVSERVFTDFYKSNVMEHARRSKCKELKIILLGDIFDFVRTDYWQKIFWDERPWNGRLNKLSRETAMNPRTDVILSHYKKAFELILDNQRTKSFISSLNEIRREIRRDAELSGIDIEIKYIIGNHDRAFGCFTELQDMFRAALTEYPASDVEFAYRFADEANYAAICRHGHEFDENNFGADLWLHLNGVDPDSVTSKLDRKYFNVQTIGEVITAELMSGIIYRLIKANVNSDVVDLIRDINNVRPMKDVLLWLCWSCYDLKPDDKEALMKALRESVKAVLDTTLAGKWDGLKKGFLIFNTDITDMFGELLNVIRGKTFDEVNELVSLLGGLFGGDSATDEDPYKNAAAKMLKAPANAKVQYVIMGHTHDFKEIPLSGSPGGRYSGYINTGTLLPYIDRAQGLRKVSFVSTSRLSMVSVFRRDENKSLPAGNLYPTHLTSLETLS